MPFTFLIVLLVMLIAARSIPAYGQTTPLQRFEVVAQTGGPITDSVPMPDGTVLAAEGSNLIRVRSINSSLEVLARSDMEHGMILALASAPSYVLALSEQGVMVLPKNAENVPEPITFLAGGGQAIAIQNDLVAIASQQAGLWLLRLGSDGSLTDLSRLTLEAPGGSAVSALDITLSPDTHFAYVAAGSDGVQVIDISSPEAPIPFGSLPGITPAEAVTMSGSLLAVGSAGHIVMVDPQLRTNVGVYAPLRQARRMVIQDGYAYIADEAEGLKILWLAAPDRPLLIYSEVDHPAFDVELSGTTLFVAGREELRIFDISSRYRPLTLGRIALPGNAEGIALEVDDTGAPQRAFIAMGDAGIAILDVRNFAAPSVLTLVHLDGSAHATHYFGGTLYVAVDTAGLAIVDASVVGLETLKATMALPGRALDLDQRGSTLFVAAGSEGVLALNIFYAFTPKLIGVLPLEALDSSGTTHEAQSITIVGKRAYVADDLGFSVIDIAAPVHMGKLAQVESTVKQVGIDGVYLYAVGGSQMNIYDARATAEPLFLSTYRGLSKIAHLEAKGSSLFVTSAESGPDALVISVLSPDALAETGSTGSRGNTLRLTPIGSEVWLAAGLGGLRHYELSEGGALIPRGSYAPVAEASLLLTDEGRLIAGGLHGWSILDPTELTVSGTPTEAQNLISIAVQGDIAAVLSESRLTLYDLSSAEGATQLTSQEVIGGSAVQLDAQYVYVAGVRGLAIYDRSYLLPVAQIATPYPVVDLAVRSSVAYLALSNGSISVIDLADPTGGIVRQRSIPTQRPTQLVPDTNGTLYGLSDEQITRLYTADINRLGVSEEGTMPVIAPDGFFAGSLLGVPVDGKEARFYDLSHLHTGPTWQGLTSIDAGDFSVEAVIANERDVFAALGDGGAAWIIRGVIGSQQGFDSVPTHALLLNGSTLFTAGDELKAWDISADEPRQLSSIALMSPARHIDQAANGTILVSTASGLTIASWDGASLTEMGSLTLASVDRAALIGSRAYLALHHGGLAVLDVGDLHQPSNLFTYVSPTGEFVYDLLPLDDDYLLVSWENGIDALNISSPTPAPHLVDTLTFGAEQALRLRLNQDATMAAMTTGNTGVQLLNLANPMKPTVIGSIDTPGEAREALFDQQTLFVADGQCGLRAYDLSNIDDIASMGAWRGSYAGSIAESAGIVFVGSGNKLFGVRYNPSGSAPMPAIPQVPDPQDGDSTTTLETVLRWGPPEDSCDPLTYDVYFGMDSEPPFAGKVTSAPLLDVGKLEPQRTYSWRVEAIDAAGNRTKGPMWHFTSAPGTFPDTLPPAPPPFIDTIKRNPVVPFGMIFVFIVLGAVSLLYWRNQRSHEEPDVPEWYSTQSDEDLAEADEDL